MDNILSSGRGMKISLIGGFPLGSLSLINLHKGRIHDVTHCYNLGKKWVPPYVMSVFLIQ